MLARQFNPDAKIHTDPYGTNIAVQDFDRLDALYETAQEAEDTFTELSQALANKTNGQFHLGPRKIRKTAEDKIARDYDGDSSHISDIVRGKLVVDSVEAIEITRDFLNIERTNPTLDKHKSYCAQLSDYFAEPKAETGYRAINAKIAIPVGGEGKHHLVELQIVHKGIDATYNRTHRHMRQAQNIATKYRHTQIPNEEAIRMAGHYAVCKYENGTAAQEAGLDRLLNNQTFALSDCESKSLQGMIKHQRFGHY